MVSVALIPFDVLNLIIDHLTLRDTVRVAAVSRRWRSFVAAQARTWLLRFFPQYCTSDIIENTSQVFQHEIKRSLTSPLSRHVLPTSSSHNTEGAKSPMISHCAIQREGFVPETRGRGTDIFWTKKGFAYNNGLMAWQASPFYVIVDDLRQGLWHTYECPLALDCMRVTEVTSKLLILFPDFDAVGGFEPEVEEHFIVCELASGRTVPYQLSYEEVMHTRFRAHDDVIYVSNCRGKDHPYQIKRLRLVNGDNGQISLQLEETTLIPEVVNHFFIDSTEPGTFYTVTEWDGSRTTVVKGFRNGKQFLEHSVVLPVGFFLGLGYALCQRSMCRPVDDRGTWEILTVQRFAQCVSTLLFNTSSKQFFWRNRPTRTTNRWDEISVLWNGWNYTLDFQAEHAMDAEKTNAITVEAMSDPLELDDVYVPWESESSAVYDIRGGMNLGGQWLCVDNDYIVTTPETYKGCGLISLKGRGSDLVLKKGAHYKPFRDQWTVAWNNNEEEVLANENHGDGENDGSPDNDH